ncbi:hypothetical protein [Salibacterium aidingense]|uniref:hypothetical protein n=1 Tax=Salibacterium aidingense TaxID=384933 RepID=UPI000425DC9B|nr:hypothetical protein [Salibacterium aidingense]
MDVKEKTLSGNREGEAAQRLRAFGAGSPERLYERQREREEKPPAGAEGTGWKRCRYGGLVVRVSARQAVRIWCFGRGGGSLVIEKREGLCTCPEVI